MSNTSQLTLFGSLAAITLLTFSCGGSTQSPSIPQSQAEPTPTTQVDPTPKKDAAFVLYVAKDESELERKIGTYLSGLGLHVQYREKDNDLVLYMDYSAESGIAYEIMIDTWFSSDDEKERLVAIRLLTGMEVSDAELPSVYSHINAHHVDNWAGTFYVDSQQKIRGQWTINIPEVNLPAELIRDSMHRIASSWLKLRKAILADKMVHGVILEKDKGDVVKGALGGSVKGHATDKKSLVWRQTAL